MEIKSSGSFREFASGAIRDDGDGQKGRMDLVPLGVVGAIMGDSILINLDVYVRTGDKSCIVDAIKSFVKMKYPDMESAILDVSLHYKDGSTKYKPRNWEKGINLSSYIDSGARHYLKVLRGEMIDLPFVENINAEENDKLAFLASNMSEEELNKFVSMWQKYHSEGE